MCQNLCFMSPDDQIVSPQNAKSTKSQSTRYSNRTHLLISSGSLSVLHAPPPPLPLLPSFIWISWEAICCMRPVPNHRNHVSIKCFPAWDAFITLSTIWTCKMYDDRGQARTLKFRRYFNVIVIKFFTPWLLAADFQENDKSNPAFLTTSDEFSYKRLSRLREPVKNYLANFFR